MTASHALSQLSYSPERDGGVLRGAGVVKSVPLASHGFPPARGFTHFVDGSGGSTDPRPVNAGRHRRVARAVAGAAAVATLLFGGCAPRPESDLLEVREVGPERVEADSRLEVRGAGFPAGRVAELRLEGRLHRPGERPRQVRVDLEGRARSADLLEVILTEAALEELGRGTLHGRLTVAFDAVGEGAVVGRSPPIVLDVAPPSRERLGAALDHRRRATELTQVFGVELSEEDPSAAGLPVRAVREGSPATAAGLVEGDRVVALDGLRLHNLSDFVPAPDVSLVRVEVAREGEAGTFEVALSVPARQDAVPLALLRFGQAALAWVLVILLTLAPSASLLDWLIQPSSAPRRSKPGVRMLRQVVGGAFLIALVALERAELLHVPLEIVLVSTLAAKAAAAHLGTPAGTRPWARLGALAGALGASVLAAVAVSAVGAAGGSTDLVTLHEQQGAWPWEWAAARSPAGPLTAVLIVAAGAYRRRAAGAGASSRLAGAVEELVALVLAAVVAAVLLGGWRAPSHAHWIWTALGPALFALKGLVCWAAMRRAARMGSRWLARGTVALLAAASAAAWIVWEPPGDVVQALAEVTTAAAGVVALSLVLRRLTDPPQPEPVPLHPFL